MKKLIFAILAAAAGMLTGCKEESGYNNITLNTYKLDMRAGDAQKVEITSGNPDDVRWRSENEFIATVDDGLISAQRIGQTRITANNAAVVVTVEGLSNLYDNPMDGLSWGMTQEQLYDKLGMPSTKDEKSMTYNMVSAINSLKTYSFVDNRLVSAAITVTKDKTSQLDDYLNERYLLLNDDETRQDRDYINALTYSMATLLVTRTSYDDNYWLVSYKQIND